MPVPDASRITPIVNNPESRDGHDISVAVDLDTGFNAAAVESVRTRSVTRLADGRQHVELARGTSIPNKDFVLELREGNSAQPKTALFLSPDKRLARKLLPAGCFSPPTVKPYETRAGDGNALHDRHFRLDEWNIDSASAEALCRRWTG